MCIYLHYMRTKKTLFICTDYMKVSMCVCVWRAAVRPSPRLLACWGFTGPLETKLSGCFSTDCWTGLRPARPMRLRLVKIEVALCVPCPPPPLPPPEPKSLMMTRYTGTSHPCMKMFHPVALAAQPSQPA